MKDWREEGKEINERLVRGRKREEKTKQISH